MGQSSIVKDCLMTESERHEVGDLSLMTFNDICDQDLVSREHMISKLFFSEDFINFVVFVLQVVKSKSFFNIFWFHFSNGSNDIKPIFLWQLKPSNILLAIPTWGKSIITNIQKFVNINQTASTLCDQEW